MERLYAVFVIALVLTLGAFTFYLFNYKVFLQPAGGFVIQDTLAPVGAGLAGTNSIFFCNPAIDPVNCGQFGRYVFRHTDTQGATTTNYRIDLNDLMVRNGVLRIWESVSNTYPVYDGGTRFLYEGASQLSPVQLASVFNRQFTHSLSGNVLTLNFIEQSTSPVFTVQKKYEIEIIGKTLVIRASAVNPLPYERNNYNGFTLGFIKDTTNPNYIIIPYMENAPIVYYGAGLNRKYQTSYIDWTKSGSNNWPTEEFNSGIGLYSRHYSSNYLGGMNDGTGRWIAPLEETAYVTVSNNINEVMMNVNRNPSQYLTDLKNRVTLDIWSPSQSSYFSGVNRFERSTSMINTMKNYGMDNLLVSYTPWNQVGIPPCYLMYPKHLPANIFGGGDVGFSSFVNTATNNGFLFTVYQIYNDMYATPPLGSTEEFGPQWDPSKLVKDPNGNYRNFGWVNDGCPPIASPIGGTVPQPLVIKPSEWLNYAEAESPLIKQNYQTTAAFLDVHPKLPYPLLIDFSIGSLTRSFKEVYNYQKQLFNFQRNAYQGPLVGEGGTFNSGFTTDTIHAGLVDAVEGEITNGKNAGIIPDFELRNVKSKMMRQGMGYPNRWLNNPTMTIDPSIFDWDDIRSDQISFGHSGFMTDYFLLYDASYTAWPPNQDYHTQMMNKIIKYWINEYYLFSELQKLYLNSDVTNILYRNPPTGQYVDLMGAIDAGLNFNIPQLKIEYQNGLVIYVNKNPTSVWQVTEGGINYYLPTNGWLAVQPSSGLLVYSGLVDDNGIPSPSGHRVDYAATGEYLMVNGRGTSTPFINSYTGTLQSTYMTVLKPNGFRLTENSLGEFSTTTTNYCGDNYCSSALSETCNSCSVDCGQCATAPAAPSTLTVTTPSAPLGETQLNLNWVDNSNNENGFRIERCVTSSCTFGFVANVGANVVNYPDSGLSSGESYSYRVRSYNSLVGGWSNTATGSTLFTLPTPPTDLSATPLSTSSVSVTWTDIATNEDGYRLYRCQGSGCTDFALIITRPANSNSFPDTSLTPNTFYRYRVDPFNQAGSTNSNIAEVTTTSNTCNSYSSSSTCEADSSCDWCTDCNGPLSSGGLPRCVNSGSCPSSAFICRTTGPVTCGAQCQGASEGCESGSLCSSSSCTCIATNPSIRFINGEISPSWAWSQNTPVTITGRDFATDARVIIDSNVIVPSSISPTILTFNYNFNPLINSGTHSLKVRNVGSGLESSPFTISLTTNPSITSLTSVPPSPVTNTILNNNNYVVSFIGDDLNPVMNGPGGDSGLLLSGVPVPSFLITPISPTQVNLFVPGGQTPRDYDFTIRNYDGEESNPITLRINALFNYQVTPSISSISSSSGANFEIEVEIESNEFMTQERVNLNVVAPSGVTANIIGQNGCTPIAPLYNCLVRVGIVVDAIADSQQHVVSLNALSSATGVARQASFVINGPSPPAPPSGPSGGPGSSGGPTPPKIVKSACDDGKDNDGDGLKDYPNDLGCSSKVDNNEVDASTLVEPDITPDEDDQEELDTDEKDIKIRPVFLLTLGILITGIVIVGVLVVRVIRTKRIPNNKFRDLASVPNNGFNSKQL